MAWNGGEAYNVVARIGKGAFANVYKISTKQDGEVFAAKEIELRRFLKDGNLGHKAHNEIDVMKQLIHVSLYKTSFTVSVKVTSLILCSQTLSDTSITRRQLNTSSSSWSMFHTVI